MTAVEALTDDIPAKRTTNAIVHSGFIVAGVVTVILGPILPILIARWSMSDERAGLFFTLQFCGNLMGIASLGSLISRRGYGQTLGIGFSFIALGIAALNLGSEFVCLIATAGFGYGLGVVLSATNLWVAEAAASRRASALSILNLAWGIGAITCPVLVMLAQRSHWLGLLLFGIAGLSTLHALALVSVGIEPRQQRGATVPTFRGEPPVGMKTALALGGLFFLYCGTESAVGGWAAAFAKRTGTNPGNFWELAPMFFWAGLLTGRALGPFVLRRVTERTVLILGLMLAGACNGALLWVAKPQVAAISLIGAGLGFRLHLSFAGGVDGWILRQTGATRRKRHLRACEFGRSHDSLACGFHFNPHRQPTCWINGAAHCLHVHAWSAATLKKGASSLRFR